MVENQNIQAIETLSNAMQAMVDKKMDSVARDRTRSGMIKTVNADGTYKVLIDGKEYDKVPTYGVASLQVNNIIKVVYPDNNPTNMFILSPSGGGGGGSALDAYPVGSIYMSVSSTSPATLFGGTWVAIADGQVLVGIKVGDTDFDTSGKTGGSKTIALAETNIPAHTHTMNHDHPAGSTGTASANHSHYGEAWTNGGGGHSHNVRWRGYNITALTTGQFVLRRTDPADSYQGDDADAAQAVGDHQHYFGVTVGNSGADHYHGFDVANFTGSTGSIGSTTAHNNLQPFLVVYMWKRTA